MEYLNTIEVCEVFKVDKSTVSRWRKQGLPHTKLKGVIHFLKSDVEEWANNPHDKLFNKYEIVGNVVYIHVENKKFEITRKVMIDADQLEKIKLYNWKLIFNHERKPSYEQVYYAVASSKGKSIFMHRLLMGFPKGLVVDHINGNGLDNRLSNLRAVSYSTNNLNTYRHRL